ncbi:MAG: hypothetical protein MUC95_05530 [Spirochaetes bacterium]|jgi:CheY-like chemotaxis protein|nr:hypothetical protein [Spirochaetota bacterium]
MENKKILIAENGRPGAELLRQILTHEGYNVDSAYNGKDGMEAKPGNIYHSPSEKHMTVCCKNPAI